MLLLITELIRFHYYLKFHYVKIPQFFHFSVNGHLDSFCLGWVNFMSNSTMSIFFLIYSAWFYLLIFKLINYFWLCWVFVSVRGLFSSCGKRGPLFITCAGFSLSRPLLLRSTGSRRAGSVVVAHGPSCSAACGIFPDQGSNPCLLHWQADS